MTCKWASLMTSHVNIYYCRQPLESSLWKVLIMSHIMWTATSEFGTYSLCEQRRFRRACASAQSRQNLRCSLIQAVSQEEPSDRKLDPWPLWMAGHAQLKFVMTECSKTQIRLTGLMLETKQFFLTCVLSLINTWCCRADATIHSSFATVN